MYWNAAVDSKALVWWASSWTSHCLQGETPVCLKNDWQTSLFRQIYNNFFLKIEQSCAYHLKNEKFQVKTGVLENLYSPPNLKDESPQNSSKTVTTDFWYCII